MKRFLSLTLVAIMLLTTLMLTSCDPISEVKGFINKVLGREEVRYTITEEEWDNVLNITNFTFEISASDEEYSVSMIYKASDNAMYAKTDLFGEEIEAYFDIAAGYSIMKNDAGAWEGQKSELNEDENTLGAIGFFPELNFSDFTYDESLKAYVYEDVEGETKYEFYFENGNIVRMKAYPTDPEIDGIISLTNIGSTTVELPKYTKVD